MGTRMIDVNSARGIPPWLNLIGNDHAGCVIISIVQVALPSDMTAASQTNTGAEKHAAPVPQVSGKRHVSRQLPCVLGELFVEAGFAEPRLIVV